MNSTDPDPDRTSRPKRAQISLHWSPDAKREYSRIAVAWAAQSREADSGDESTPPASTRPESTPPGEVPTRTALNALARRAVRQTLQHAPFKLALPDNNGDAPVFAVDVSFVSDAEILELNSSHRGKNKPTDVLSYSQLEGELMPFEMEEILLGDVIVSIETAARQAQELKHSLAHEIAFLLAHGVLHLCGYDHDTSARRRAMWKQQDEIVRLLNLGEPKLGEPNPG